MHSEQRNHKMLHTFVFASDILHFIGLYFSSVPKGHSFSTYDVTKEKSCNGTLKIGVQAKMLRCKKSPLLIVLLLQFIYLFHMLD